MLRGMSLAFKALFSKRPTYIASYMLVRGELRPEKPKQCIFCQDVRGFCHITSKGKRWRKVGLEHPLFVFGCSDHCVCFTVYPWGWSQYGRRSLIEIAPDGSDIDTDITDAYPEADHADTDSGIVAVVDGGDTCVSSVDIWQETAFGAATDAANGRRWPLTRRGILSAKEPKPYGVFETQQRHIAGILRLFCLDTESNDKAREAVAARLPVSFSALKSSAANIRDGPEEDRWRREGSEGQATTQKLTPPRCWLKHLLELGAAVNFWGSPMYGDWSQPYAPLSGSMVIKL